MVGRLTGACSRTPDTASLTKTELDSEAGALASCGPDTYYLDHRQVTEGCSLAPSSSHLFNIDLLPVCSMATWIHRTTAGCHPEGNGEAHGGWTQAAPQTQGGTLEKSGFLALLFFQVQGGQGRVGRESDGKRASRKDT